MTNEEFKPVGDFQVQCDPSQWAEGNCRHSQDHIHPIHFGVLANNQEMDQWIIICGAEKAPTQKSNQPRLCHEGNEGTRITKVK